jgi:S-DNA-T family DNA segregation ATPase FtsK/SpoIIIE
MKNENTQNTPDVTSKELSLKNEIIGIIALFVAIFFIFSLVSYTPLDPSFFKSSPDKHVDNFGGPIGAQVSAILFNLFGYASFIIVFYFLFVTVFFLINKTIPNMGTKSAGYSLLLFSFSAFISNIAPYAKIDNSEVKTGGIAGYFIAEFFQGEITQVFSFFLFLSLILISLVLIARLSLRNVVKFLVKISGKLFRRAGAWIKIKYEEHQKNKRIKKIQKKHNEKPGIIQKEATSAAGTPKWESKEAKEEKSFYKEQKGFFKDKKKIVREPSKLPEETSLFAEFDKEFGTGKKYQSPPLTYLDAATERSKIDYKELENKKEELKQRLNEFRIKGEIVEYTPGPVITTYEFVPDTGIKVKEVTNLAEDLALVAKAQYVRIERILGKKAIGIEIPNKKREIIHLREILESEAYQESVSPLTIALGKNKSGEIFISDLRDMPHLIIAGATGSGKSVAVHSMILSILFKASPDEVKLVLIDPKRVELAFYNTLPHLLTPVVVDTKLAKNALDWAVFEMEERYKKLALMQVRNLDQYNRKLELMLQTEDDALDNLETPEKIPYIVIIIDEFADLMMECSREIEQDVARIAQKARAVGIHVILATQRPSIDVITGTIKNNFPSRIALAVPSKHDSRTIIDIMGAEKLLGNGDMLFLPPKTASLVRLHCAYVSEEEILRVVNYLAKMGKPKFNTQVLKPKQDDETELTERDLDELFFDAAEVVINTGQASASYLQRKMSIGYARAGRLIDQLQKFGVVTQADKQNKREVLMSLDDLDQFRDPHGQHAAVEKPPVLPSIDEENEIDF